MRSVKPDFYLVGEMWGGDTLIAPYLKAGMNAGFNFDLWFNIKASLQKEDDLITKKLFAAYENYSMNNPIFCDATLLSNHDNPRIMNEVKGNMDKAKLAAAILLTLPYTPYIYYGDELGMFGPKPDEHIREPFLWAQKDKAKCSWELNYNNKNTSTFPEQSSDPASIYNTYKSLIQFRNSNEVLTDGKLIPAPIIKTGILAYIRQNNGKQYLVLHNLSSSTLDVDLSALNKNDYRIVFNTGVLPIIKTNFITLQKYSSVIIDF
jgi:glycosidase